ncbi:invasion associated locus B family protein [Methylobacterium currus]|uniref:invasion associated locus B family protein n=1 Tax=Methylobacterium currus TaxID=2051553 RepID=UPI001E2AA56A|nr:invasion associated locus B family protein [Methylobacterium currus]UHC13879.1 invasion associated locus B family protein [Methylobacterium currus]
MPGRRGRSAALVAALLLLIPGSAAAQLRGSLGEAGPEMAPVATGSVAPAGRELGQPPGFAIKPVAGAPAKPGVRRVIETFGGWTLICDEERGRRICNASQSIVAAGGHLAFSWSLAATRGGEPVFILRAPVTEFPAHTVTLGFGQSETVIRLPTCDAALCVGFLPLDAAIVRQIKSRAGVTIRYRVREGAAPVTIAASLDGLGAAIGSIR